MCGIDEIVRPLIHPPCRLVWLLLLQTLDGHSTEVDSVLFDVQEAVRLGGRELRAAAASLRQAVPKRAVAHAHCVCVCVCARAVGCGWQSRRLPQSLGFGCAKG